MSNVKMGFEGQLLLGTAGSTGTNVLENARDITLNLESERGDTTVRGDSTVPPIKTEQVSMRMLGIEFGMVNDTTDTHLQTLLEAADAGTEVALRGRDYAAGKGPDADFSISVTNWNMPLNGEQLITFSATPSRGSGRTPLRYV